MPPPSRQLLLHLRGCLYCVH